jgi:hypothetical protein
MPTGKFVTGNHNIHGPVFKGIVSRDWGGLLMVLLDIYSILDIAAKYLKFNIFMPLRRALPGSKVRWAVVPNHNFSARSTKMVGDN